jgi:hypothetical protein
MTPLADQIACLKREIALRKNVYPGFVRRCKMKPEQADLEIERMTAALHTLMALDTPELQDFMKAIPLEATHQNARWPEGHDENKTSEEWYWLIAHLAGKALAALRYNDVQKALHHTITVAAACANWHKHIKNTKPEAQS